MTNVTPITVEPVDQVDADAGANTFKPQNVSPPSNHVHARVGNAVLRAAREGVRGGVRPDVIIRDIVSEHHIRLNLSEFRLLLASRPLPKRNRKEHLTLLASDAE
jgi:hypothetical protein